MDKPAPSIPYWERFWPVAIYKVGFSLWSLECHWVMIRIIAVRFSFCRDSWHVLRFRSLKACCFCGACITWRWAAQASACDTRMAVARCWWLIAQAPRTTGCCGVGWSVASWTKHQVLPRCGHFHCSTLGYGSKKMCGSFTHFLRGFRRVFSLGRTGCNGLIRSQIPSPSNMNFLWFLGHKKGQGSHTFGEIRSPLANG